ncbi:MAG: sodium/solute symporter [Planctomycetota bacterium]
MELSVLDIVIFVAFFAVVISVSMYKSRKEKTGEDFFLASRALFWPLIGLSLIAANISSEHFVGMAGQGAGLAGLAIASYEWMAAITLVFVALFFLPRFLRCGIYTIPEFLEYRYHHAARGIMAFYLLVIYVCVSIVSVVYSGALALDTIFGMDIYVAIFLIAIIAAVYTTWGGLKAVAWADLFQGSALIIGGVLCMVIGFGAVGGVGHFFEVNREKLHMFLPSDHSVIPWTALVVGLWIPNFYYWGFNQFIVQRALAAKSVKQGQLGIIFAAFMKLTIPFIIVLPAIMAWQLYSGELAANPDRAYPVLIRELIPAGVRGFIFAAIAGAVISTLGSLLNSVSTILTVDLYKRHIKTNVSPEALVKMGRFATIVFVGVVCAIACALVPYLRDPNKSKGVFTYIQEFQGYISPGVLAAFIFALFVKRAPPAAGIVALVLCPVSYGVLHILSLSENETFHIAFLNRMAITFGLVLLVMTVITLMRPLREPKQLPVRADMDPRPHPAVAWLGALVIAITVTLYIVFA